MYIKKSKKMLVYLLSSILVLIALISAATYAYFASTITVGNYLYVNATTAPGSYSFVSYSGNSISMTLTAAMMQQANASTTAVLTKSGDMSVKLISPVSTATASCTFNVVWIWDSESSLYTSSTYMPYSSGGTTYPYQFSIKVYKNGTLQTLSSSTGGTESDLSKFTWAANSNSLQQATLIAEQSMSTTSTTGITNTYKVDALMYNIPRDQTEILAKSFKAKISVANVSCTLT